MEKLNLRRMIGICGACIAFYIGAGFATMQEVVQYEASYGSRFLVVIAVAAAIYIYTNLSFATNGNKLHLEHGGDIYRIYCGNKIGTFYDYFAAFFFAWSTTALKAAGWFIARSASALRLMTIPAFLRQPMCWL